MSRIRSVYLVFIAKKKEDIFFVSVISYGDVDDVVVFVGSTTSSPVIIGRWYLQ